MFKIFSAKRKKYRLALFMFPVVVPGLIISGFGIHSISRQKKAIELKLEEKYTETLEQMVVDVERHVEESLETTLQQISKSQTLFGTDRTQSNQGLVVIKELLLNNPLVKYPFIIDSGGKFIFPFSKKSFAHPAQPLFSRITDPGVKFLYDEGERLEFKEREMIAALKYYTKCIKNGVGDELKHYIFNSIARCYFKSGKYFQSIDYYKKILSMFKKISPAKRDYWLYFPVIRQMALSYQRLGWKDKAVERYLQLYDEILQYEVSSGSDNFTFFKNEALEYLNQYINIRLKPKDNKGSSEPAVQSGTPDRLREFAGPEISLRWSYFELDGSSNIGDDTTASYLENRDFYRFMKIREFYLSTNEKTQFYKAVKGMKQWAIIDPAAVEIEKKRIRAPGSKDLIDVVFKKHHSSPIYFGFMISPDFLSSDEVLGILKKRLESPDLQVFVLSGKKPERQPGRNRNYRFPLLSVNMDRFFPGKMLVLYSRESSFFTNLARKEIRLNYLLMGAFILVLIFGVWLFYKYLSREAELVRLKSEFTDRASHTLKTPLTRIRMLAEKLQLGWVSDESKKQEYLQTILSESDRMNEMMTNMLDFSRIEAGRKQYNFENASLAEIVKEVLESYAAYIRNLGFQLHIEIEDNIPGFLMDPDAIRLIVVNLLQNAVKYSIREKVIAIRVYREKETLVLEITDSGIGINKIDRKKVFERFYRASDRAVQAVEGSGLGLYLVQHAVQAHQGEVKITGDIGKGTCFLVILPIREKF